MERIVLNKLVHDKVPDILKRKGVKYKAARVRDMERALIRKLYEEMGKLAGAEPKDRIQELADIYEVLETLTRHWGIRTQKIRKAQKGKRKLKGGFNKGILLFWIKRSAE